MTIIEGQRIVLPDATATVAAGAAIATGLRGGMVVGLTGELGAGKTTLVRGMLRGLGWTGSVKSPTYTLVEHYAISSLYFYHFDFYRFSEPDEWESTGFSEYFRPDAVCVIEWPERVAVWLPQIDISLTLEHAPGGRTLQFAACTEAGNECLAICAAGLR